MDTVSGGNCSGGAYSCSREQPSCMLRFHFARVSQLAAQLNFHNTNDTNALPEYLYLVDAELQLCARLERTADSPTVCQATASIHYENEFGATDGTAA